MTNGGLPFSGTGCPVPDVVSIYSIWNVLSRVYCFYICRPPMMFLSTEFLIEKLIGVVTVILTYKTQDHQHKCFMFSNRFSSLWLGLWIIQLLPVWWSDFTFIFLNDSWCVRWYSEEEFSIDIYILSLSLYIALVLHLICPLIWLYSEIFFSYFVLSYFIDVVPIDFHCKSIIYIKVYTCYKHWYIGATQLCSNWSTSPNL